MRLIHKDCNICNRRHNHISGNIAICPWCGTIETRAGNVTKCVNRSGIPVVSGLRASRHVMIEWTYDMLRLTRSAHVGAE